MNTLARHATRLPALMPRHCAGLGRRLAELFESANLDSARAVAHPEPFCMADRVSDVIQVHQLGAEKQGVSLRLTQGADLLASVLAGEGSHRPICRMCSSATGPRAATSRRSRHRPSLVRTGRR